MISAYLDGISVVQIDSKPIFESNLPDRIAIYTNVSSEPTKVYWVGDFILPSSIQVKVTYFDATHTERPISGVRIMAVCVSPTLCTLSHNVQQTTQILPPNIDSPIVSSPVILSTSTDDQGIAILPRFAFSSIAGSEGCFDIWLSPYHHNFVTMTKIGPSWINSTDPDFFTLTVPMINGKKMLSEPFRVSPKVLIKQVCAKRRVEGLTVTPPPAPQIGLQTRLPFAIRVDTQTAGLSTREGVIIQAVVLPHGEKLEPPTYRIDNQQNRVSALLYVCGGTAITDASGTATFSQFGICTNPGRITWQTEDNEILGERGVQNSGVDKNGYSRGYSVVDEPKQTWLRILQFEQVIRIAFIAEGVIAHDILELVLTQRPAMVSIVKNPPFQGTCQ